MSELNHERRYPFSPDDGRFRGRLGEEALRLSGIDRGRETHFITGGDRRQLAVELSGREDGHTVFLFHGSPGSRTGPKLSSAMLWQMGINLITYDRPGYGYSDPNPGRRPIDTVDDIHAIIDYLGVEEGFSIVGRSGGGPHALACAAALPGVKRTAALVSSAPRRMLGERHYDGLGSANTEDSRAQEQGRENLTDRVKRMQQDPSVLLDVISPDFAEDDRRVVRSNLKAEILKSWGKAIQFGPEGWIDDVNGQDDWGFDPRDITVPTLVWYGGRDPFVPPVNGRWLADNIPTAQEVYVPEASHFRACFEAVPAVLGWCATGEYRPYSPL